MRQNEQEESAVEQGALLHLTISESPQIEKVYMPPKRRRRATTDRSKPEFEPLDLPPKRPYLRRLVTDLDASEDNKV